MNKKGYTTESGGRQNGFALEPEINPISEGESKKSLLLFIGILLPFLIGGYYYLMTLWSKDFLQIVFGKVFFGAYNILH